MSPPASSSRPPHTRHGMQLTLAHTRHVTLAVCVRLAQRLCPLWLPPSHPVHTIPSCCHSKHLQSVLKNTRRIVHTRATHTRHASCCTPRVASTTGGDTAHHTRPPARPGHPTPQPHPPPLPATHRAQWQAHRHTRSGAARCRCCAAHTGHTMHSHTCTHHARISLPQEAAIAQNVCARSQAARTNWRGKWRHSA
jgi:hypothetical protein